MLIKALYNRTWVTRNKIYECYEETDKYFCFIDDDGGKQQQLKDRFAKVKVLFAKYNLPTDSEEGKDLRYEGQEYCADGIWYNFSEWEDEYRKVWLQCRETDSIFNQLKRIE